MKNINELKAKYFGDFSETNIYGILSDLRDDIKEFIKSPNFKNINGPGKDALRVVASSVDSLQTAIFKANDAYDTKDLNNPITVQNIIDAYLAPKKIKGKSEDHGGAFRYYNVPLKDVIALCKKGVIRNTVFSMADFGDETNYKSKDVLNYLASLKDNKITIDLGLCSDYVIEDGLDPDTDYKANIDGINAGSDKNAELIKKKYPNIFE